MSWKACRSTQEGACVQACNAEAQQVDIGGHGWTLVDIGGHGWTLVDIGGHWWTWVDIGGHGWTLVDIGGHGWTLVDIGGHEGKANPHARPCEVPVRCHTFNDGRLYKKGDHDAHVVAL